MSYIRQLLIRQALRHKTNRPSGLIGQYKPYLNSNDSPSRDILKDYSGQGHDIQLYNFAFSESSGYGKFLPKFSKSGSNKIDDSKSNIGIYKLLNLVSGHGLILYGYPTTEINFRFKISNIPDGVKANIQLYDSVGTVLNQTVNTGINSITTKFNEDSIRRYVFISFDKGIEESDLENPVIIQFLPDYPGALVSDGVDDYGLCENFPILTKEKGYTVVALRKWLTIEQDRRVFISNDAQWNSGKLGAFVFEEADINHRQCRVFGLLNSINSVFDNNLTLSYLTSKKYNGFAVNSGENQANNSLLLFAANKSAPTYFSSIALYALEIYDHDLTDEEIESVKEAMVREYEKETGNVL